MSDYDNMDQYELDENSAVKAEEGRIDTSGAYICKIIKAEAVTSDKGTKGVMLNVNSIGTGETEFTLWTKKEDGSSVFGYNQLQALMMLIGVKTLRGAKGTVSKWNNELGERIEAEGVIFPDLVGKRIGLVLQKELYTTRSDKTAFRMNLIGSYHPESRLTCSELKDRKVKPEKLDTLLARLKDKDSRKTPEVDPVLHAAVSAIGF